MTDAAASRASSRSAAQRCGLGHLLPIGLEKLSEITAPVASHAAGNFVQRLAFVQRHVPLPHHRAGKAAESRRAPCADGSPLLSSVVLKTGRQKLRTQAKLITRLDKTWTWLTTTRRSARSIFRLLVTARHWLTLSVK